MIRSRRTLFRKLQRERYRQQCGPSRKKGLSVDFHYDFSFHFPDGLSEDLREQDGSGRSGGNRNILIRDRQ